MNLLKTGISKMVFKMAARLRKFCSMFNKFEYINMIHCIDVLFL